MLTSDHLKPGLETLLEQKSLLLHSMIMDTPIDFSAFVMNQLNIINPTQEILVGPAFNLLKGTCKSRTELEYHFEEFTSLKIMKWYDYGHLDEIEVRREDQQLYKFKECDFSRLRLQDIEDMLLLLFQQKLTNLTIDEHYDLNVALQHQSDTKVFTMKMEILLEPTSNKLCGRNNKYEHVGPKVTSTQGGKRSKDDDKRLYLANDLKMTQDHKQVKTMEQALTKSQRSLHHVHKMKSRKQVCKHKTEDRA
ncbi:hypothetical protein Tco_0115017 [Tanacetum coccineum]